MSYPKSSGNRSACSSSRGYGDVIFRNVWAKKKSGIWFILSWGWEGDVQNTSQRGNRWCKGEEELSEKGIAIYETHEKYLSEEAPDAYKVY